MTTQSVRPNAFPNLITTRRPSTYNELPIENNMVINDSDILVLYTGGTIGMKNSIGGYVCEPNYFENKLRSMQQFHDPDAPEVIGPNDQKMLVMPESIFRKRVRYQIIEYSPLLDSCNMEMHDWARIASDIEKWYSVYDGFVIIHGTDTMAYTASALSFMLENLGKSVVITGSQVPLSETRNDAVDNLLGALTIAGHFIIPEVCLYFHNKLLRGNRSTKTSAIDFDAFSSPNFEPLVKVGINIDVQWNLVFYQPGLEKFSVFTNMNRNVGTLSLFPGITESTVRAFLQPPMQGVVLETYGSGNAPDTRKDLLAALKEATDRGIVILNLTQCGRGLVSDIYATGKALKMAGVIAGSDMTTECGLAKLSYLIGKYNDPKVIREQLKASLRGELTIVSVKPRFSLLDNKFVQTVAAVLKATSKGEVDLISKALNPVLLCAAAGNGDVEGVRAMIEAGESVNSSDYDRRTPLHVACSEGHVGVVILLVNKGASVHAKDRFGSSPLLGAILNKHDEVAKILRNAGGHIGLPKDRLAYMAYNAAAMGDHELLRRLMENGADLNITDYDKRTPLHIAACEGQKEVVELLLSNPEINFSLQDRWGCTPLDEARTRGHEQILELFQKKLL